MASLNEILLIGNLTREPELKYTPGGAAVAQFGLAVNRTWKDATGNKQEEVTFFDCEVWGDVAKRTPELFHKGTAAFVRGRVKQENWVDKTTNQKRSKLKVVVERLQFAESKRSDHAPTPQPATRGDELPDDEPQDGNVSF
jgi:single-strand DNA-binding protein